jgi:hypothetical protein
MAYHDVALQFLRNGSACVQDAVVVGLAFVLVRQYAFKHILLASVVLLAVSKISTSGCAARLTLLRCVQVKLLCAKNRIISALGSDKARR